jgi:hypothetical protein
MSDSPEVFKGGGAETSVEVSNAAAERAEALKNRFEKAGEESPDTKAERVDNARHEAQEALMGKERGGAERKGSEPTASAVRRVTKKEKTAAYNKTLKEIRTQMSTPSRTFSKVIHNPVVEKTSEVVGNTVARPNAILAGSLSALILVSGVYWVAKTYGYALSGFETIGAFVVGWMIGLMVDYFRVMATGGRQR